MPNSIPANQNSERCIELLRASRQAMSDGQTISTLQKVLSILCAIAGPTVATFYPAARAVTAFFSAFILFLDAFVLEPAVKSKQELKAKIQELFDTELYHLPWNQLKCGRLPDEEEVMALAERHKRKYTEPSKALILDWYPESVGSLPIEYARFICQRSNMRWDYDLRRNFCTIYLVVLWVIFVGAIAYGVLTRPTMDNFVLSVVVPLLPASLQLWRAYRMQDETAKDSTRTKEYLENVWSKAIESNQSPEALAAEARLLQNELYDRRRRAPDIPKWLYSGKRKELEAQMKKAALAMVTTASNKLGLGY